MTATPRLGTSIFAAFLATVGCAGTSASTSASLVQVDGSSTVFPISEAVAEEFRKAGHQDFVTVGISGTGGGFQKFCRGETDISDASRPIKASEVLVCREAGIDFIELPIAYDGIAIVVNPRADWIDHITIPELRQMWEPRAQGQVKRWNQIRPEWPEREIHLFGAGVDSGTYEYFTEAITGRAKSSRGDFTSSEDDNVLVQGVAGDEGALAFLPFAYFEESKETLKLVPVVDPRTTSSGQPVAPSADAIRNGTYHPLSRPLFVYVSARSLARPPVERFMNFYLEQVAPLAEEVGYVQLGEPIYELVRAHYQARRLGSIFGHGSQVGLTIDQLLSKERAQ